MKTYLSGTMTHIPMRRIVQCEDMHYRSINKDHVRSLHDSIKRDGLDQPLVVWNGGGKKGQMVELEDGSRAPASFLIAGNHRKHALKMLLKQSPERYKELFPSGVPVIVHGGELKDAMAAQLRENLHKRDMDAEEVFPVIQKMRDDHEMKQKDIAKAIGKSEAWVSQIFDIEETLGEEASDELKKGSLKLSHARKAARKVKAARKAGKEVSSKEELRKLREKSEKRKAKGRQREERRLSPARVWERYCSIPRTIKMGRRLIILENSLGYLAGDEEYELPKELTPPQSEEKSGKSKKKK